MAAIYDSWSGNTTANRFPGSELSTLMTNRTRKLEELMTAYELGMLQTDTASTQFDQPFHNITPYTNIFREDFFNPYNSIAFIDTSPKTILEELRKETRAFIKST